MRRLNNALPPARLNWLKLQTLMFYNGYLQGKKIVPLIDGAIKFWHSILGVTDWKIHPMALATDMKTDAVVFSALFRIARADGCATIPQAMGGNLKSTTDPFVRCLYKLGEGMERALWKRDAQGRVTLADGLKHSDLFVELGVAKGDFAAQILNHNAGLRYVGIDKWDDHHNQHEMKEATAKLARFGDRAQLGHKTFHQASTEFLSQSIDLVYVDGYAHTGQEGGQTLREWWPKVKQGGILAGHDYDPQKWPETVSAVDAFAKEIGKPIEIIKDTHTFDSWLIRKC